MKKRFQNIFAPLLLALTLVFAGAGQSLAVFDDIEVLDQDAISKLTDDQLISVYIDTTIEMQASTIFHKKAGFTPKEYDKYKQLLHYSVALNMEFQKRKITPPDLKYLNDRE